MKKRKWTTFVVDRPITIGMITATIVVLGFLAYERLPVNLMPELTYPTITVRTDYPGAAPEEVEDAITRPIEEALGVVHGLVRMTSISRAEHSDVILEFQWETPMDQAIQDVRELLDSVSLPDNVRAPVVLRYDPNSDPVLTFALYGDAPLTELRYIAEEVIQPEIEGVDGVAAVRVKGGLEEEIQIEIHDKRVAQLGLNLQQIINRLQAENINLAGGRIKEGKSEYILRTLNEFESLDDIRNVIVATKQNAPVYLKDIATVKRGWKDRTLITRVDGKEAVILEVYREGDANIVHVVNRVRDKIWGVKKKKGPEKPTARRRRGRRGRWMTTEEKPLIQRLPKGLQLAALTDQSIFIRQSIREVKDSALYGGLIAILVIYLFLGSWANTLIISLSIPISVIATFLFMHLLGITLNIMSLGGLALGIGMLVDNAVVVLESIHRCLEEGDTLRDAVLRGTGEVGIAVSASTLTTICVFFPMVFVEGVAGELFSDQALTITLSLLASLISALFLIPMLRSRALQRKTTQPLAWKEWFFPVSFREYLPERPRKAFYLFYPFAWIAWLIHSIVLIVSRTLVLIGSLIAFGGYKLIRILARGIQLVLAPAQKATVTFYTTLLKGYEPLLRKSLDKPALTLLIVLVLLASTVPVAKRLGSELIPDMHQGEFYINIELPVGTSLEQTDEFLRSLTRETLVHPMVDHVALYAGSDPTSTTLYRIEGDHTGRMMVYLKPTKNLKEDEQAVIHHIESWLSRFSDIRYVIRRPTLFSMRNPMEIEVRGTNLIILRNVGQEVYERIRTLPEFTDVSLNLSEGFPEIQIRYDQARMIQYGLDPLQVATLVRDKILGNPATEFREGEQRKDIRIRIRKEERSSLKDIEEMNVNPNGFPPIPLKAVAHIQILRGPSEIRRIQQRRVALITANLRGFNLGGAVKKVQEALADLEIPEGVEIMIGGQSKEMQVSLKSMKLALALAIFLVYVVMASQFEDLMNPIIILITVPLAAIGVIWVLFIGHFSINVVVLIGMIILSGIVVNNAIVLLDYVTQLRERGHALIEAVVEAGKVRLRPILITTLTTVLALFPMAISIGAGEELRKPMAWTIIGGLTFATLLTLIIIPTLYTLVHSKLKLTLHTPEEESSP